MITKLLPYIPWILGILGLAFLVAAAWTINRAELGTTLGLVATGLIGAGELECSSHAGPSVTFPFDYSKTGTVNRQAP